MGVANAIRQASPCLRAETRYLRTLRSIHDRSDPGDEPLRKRLGELVSSAVHQERRATRSDLPVLVALPCPVPPFRVEMGEGNLDRDQALYLAERVTSELASFYWSVWEGAPREWRDVLRAAAELRENWLVRLRAVIR